MGISNALLNTVRKKASVNENEETLNINFSNIFFKSYTFDDKDHPIYIFDSTYLPNMSKISNDKNLYEHILDKLIQKLIQKLPKNKKFSLIIFSSGFKNLNWKWNMGIKIYSKLITDINNYRIENDDKLIIHKMYIVHESLWVRTIFQIWQQFKAGQILNEKELQFNAEDSFVMDENEEMYKSVSSSSIFETIYLNDLSELAQYVDITKLRISLNVYLYDLKINEYIELPSSYHNSLTTVSGAKLNKDFRQAMFEKIYERLVKESLENELVFYKQGEKKKFNILIDIINRNNYCDISQWDVYTLATVFIWFLTNKKKIFFPLEVLRSCKEFVEYVNKNGKYEKVSLGFAITFKVFKKMMEYHCYYNLIKFVIPLFINMLKHYGHTHHTYDTVTEVLVAPLCKPNRDDPAYQMDKKLGKLFISNVLTHFDDIVDQYEQLEIKAAISDDDSKSQLQQSNVKEEPKRLEPNFENRPVPHLANKNVSRQVSKNENLTSSKPSPSKQAPRVPNPRKVASVLSPLKSIETKAKPNVPVSPTKRTMGGASSKIDITDFNKPLLPFALVETSVNSEPLHSDSTFDSENEDTRFPSIPTHGNGEESRNDSDTLHFYSDDSIVQTPKKQLSSPPVLKKPVELKSVKITTPVSSSAEDEYPYSNIVLSPVKIRDFPSLKTTSRNLSVDVQANGGVENTIINGHGNNEDIWEYVITKKENNVLIKDINSFKDFEMQITSKQNQKPQTYVGSIDPKLSKDRKVSNLIMLFEERSEGYNMLKALKNKGKNR